MPQLDQLIPPTGLQPFGDAQCYDATVVAVTPQGAYVVLPGYDRELRWGPCQPPDSGVVVGDKVAVSFTAAGVPYLIGMKGGGEGGATAFTGEYTWTTGTGAVASGQLGIGAASWSAATQVNVSKTTRLGADVTNALA